ncbi:MAG: hypothetical protein M3N49_00865 [Candidatus Eremiobacteraeota bacterium]|nr:hypothetical protein [Candidatus Eremiobacteraeota bacterium]
MTQPQRFRRAIAVLGSLVVLGGCSAAVTHPAGRAAAPRGIVFIEGPMVETAHGWKTYRDVRAFRDGRLVATYDLRVLPARDRASASLIFDEAARTVRPIGGGRAWAFDPCPDASGAGRYVQLSPSGRAGLCLDAWSNTVKGDRLVLFDPRAPRTSRRVLMTSRMDAFRPAAWLDERRIAVTEYREGACPRTLRWEWATSLAIIDRTGRVLERGPCAYGVLAGPRGLVLQHWFKESTPLQDFVAAVTFQRAPGAVAHFSADGGRTWRLGRAQFADGDGRVFYADESANDNRLYEGGRPTLLTDPYGATWAKP